ncbi:uncharacterized protein LY79DRAFT_217212 [Colletotrichum navitas]|uniref:Uncharacterized protein n=1 Tax=Colletotrichum navitas TaxID=681940 RepID=A0AAD8PI85_9PEZI|nr:uncharacterized protein LY79DRAFT_217212 [Colletotrichum navitas]KAK1561450.1 hypothetical protein LY79DRAFT_217212 [Colletotrichum navitas]
MKRKKDFFFSFCFFAELKPPAPFRAASDKQPPNCGWRSDLVQRNIWAGVRGWNPTALWYVSIKASPATGRQLPRRNLEVVGLEADRGETGSAGYFHPVLAVTGGWEMKKSVSAKDWRWCVCMCVPGWIDASDVVVVVVYAFWDLAKTRPLANDGIERSFRVGSRTPRF